MTFTLTEKQMIVTPWCKCDRVINALIYNSSKASSIVDKADLQLIK